jgi:restriction system protein
MLTSRIPLDWKALENDVARILNECGFAVKTESVITTVRGKVEVDVHAQEVVEGRAYTVLCECKHWSSRVPQNVVHGFRTVVADSGAHLGYVISIAGFQSGAIKAAEISNIRLVTWQEFQKEFEHSWIKHQLVPRLGRLFESGGVHDGPLHHFGWLSGYYYVKEKSVRPLYNGWVRKHSLFADEIRKFLMFLKHSPDDARLPLRPHLNRTLYPPEALIPDTVFDAAGYMDFLEAVLAQTETVVKEFPVGPDDLDFSYY